MICDKCGNKTQVAFQQSDRSFWCDKCHCKTIEQQEEALQLEKEISKHGNS